MKRSLKNKNKFLCLHVQVEFDDRGGDSDGGTEISIVSNERTFLYHAISVRQSTVDATRAFHFVLLPHQRCSAVRRGGGLDSRERSRAHLHNATLAETSVADKHFPALKIETGKSRRYRALRARARARARVVSLTEIEGTGTRALSFSARRAEDGCDGLLTRRRSLTSRGGIRELMPIMLSRGNESGYRRLFDCA